MRGKALRPLLDTIRSSAPNAVSSHPKDAPGQRRHQCQEAYAKVDVLPEEPASLFGFILVEDIRHEL